MPKRTFTVNDTNPMGWREFQSIVDDLILRIHKSNIIFSAIAPILRSGAIPATMIANKLQIIPMIPLQLKYNEAQDDIETIASPSIPNTISSKDEMNILVVETNTNSGQSARKALKELQTKLPNSKFYYACVAKAFRTNKTTSNYTSEFVGKMTDESFEATPEEKKNLREGITIFPWETAEYELNDINACES